MRHVYIDLIDIDDGPTFDETCLSRFLVTFFRFADSVVDVRKVGSPFDLHGNDVPVSLFRHHFPDHDVGIRGKFNQYPSSRGILDFDALTIRGNNGFPNDSGYGFKYSDDPGRPFPDIGTASQLWSQGEQRQIIHEFLRQTLLADPF